MQNRTVEQRQDGERRVIWQTEPCPPWCDIVHDDRNDPADRYHSHGVDVVAMHLVPAVDFGVGALQDWRLAQLRIYLHQPIEGAQTSVQLISDDAPPKVQLDLTLDETRELADALRKAVERAAAPMSTRRVSPFG